MLATFRLRQGHCSIHERESDVLPSELEFSNGHWFGEALKPKYLRRINKAIDVRSAGTDILCVEVEG